MLKKGTGRGTNAPARICCGSVARRSATYDFEADFAVRLAPVRVLGDFFAPVVFFAPVLAVFAAPVFLAAPVFAFGERVADFAPVLDLVDFAAPVFFAPVLAAVDLRPAAAPFDFAVVAISVAPLDTNPDAVNL
ncbi:MAG: hypothetical protein KY476_09800 [Planctomycetes bacterium]|nr:hypothetical protein [Planctomycetota bacterium]